jgi:hypothetical protein
MDLAGVDWGSKILVMTVGGSAKAVAAAAEMNENNSASTKGALNLIEFCLRCICVSHSR